MARKNKTTPTTTTNRLMRDTFAIATRPALVLQPTLPVPVFLLEDRRAYHPDGRYRAPAASPKSAARIVAKPARSFGGHYKFRKYGSPSIGFSRPSGVAICHKRKTRREVLFASGHSGAGNRKGKRNYTSKFHCSK